MEVVGSTVGIVSLGIQVCDGLLKYYASWKDYESDIATTYGSIEGLQKTFALLYGEISNRSLDPNSVARVEESITACEGGIGVLQKKLEKVRGYGNPTGFREKARAHAQRASYPFKESTLVKLKEIVQELRSNLILALNTLQLHLETRSFGLVKDLNGHVQSISANVRKVGTDVDSISKRVQSVHLDQSQQNIIRWLSRTDPSSNHFLACKKHEPKTGDWFLQGPDLAKWKRSPNSLMWLYGGPGFGKTVLCSSIIEDVSRHCDSYPYSAVAFFYFSFTDAQKQSYTILLSSLIAQLFRQQPTLHNLEGLYRKYQPGLPTADSLEMALKSIITKSGEVFIIIDALDECPKETENEDREDILKWLQEISALSLTNLHILLTSRKEPDIEFTLLSSLQSMSVCLGEVQNQEDIRRYVTTQIRQDRKLSTLDEPIRKDIDTALVDGSNGMFRWVYCQIESLKKLKFMRPRDIKTVLNSLPKTLDETYDRILMGIDQAYYQEAVIALQWLAFSTGPLRIEELAEACVVNPDTQPQVDFGNRFPARGIFEVLSSLVTENVRPEDSYDRAYKWPRIWEVKLAHFSVKEYITSERIRHSQASAYGLQETSAQRFITKSCLVYILNYSESLNKTLSYKDLEEFPLLDYACRKWYDRVREESFRDCQETHSLAVRLLTSDTAMSDWLQVYVPDGFWTRPYDKRVNLGSSFYYACLLGVDSVVELLLENGENVNSQSGTYGNALQAASIAGHHQIVQRLLEAKVDVNLQGGEFGNALLAASITGRDKIVQLLLEAGIDLNMCLEKLGNALQIASDKGHDRIVQLLLTAGIDIDRCFHKSLHAASERGHDQIVHRLVQVQARRKPSFALLSALSQGHDHIAQRLLDEAKIDINARDSSFGTFCSALQIVSYNGNEVMVRLLLEKGAKVNLQSENCGSALHAAVYGGHSKILGLLLEKGVDANAQCGKHGNAMQAAAVEGSDQMVRCLLEVGADVNARGKKSGTALEAALHRGHEKIAELLLDSGADVNIQGGQYGNALELVSYQGSKGMVQRLLQAGAEVNAQSEEYGGALQAASKAGHDEIVQLLLEAGAEVNVLGGRDYSPLHAASASGHDQIVQRLLDAGASVNAHSGSFGTALNWASFIGNHQIVQRLLDAGADVNITGECLRSALEGASQLEDDQTFEMLLKAGADVNAQGTQGGNALQTACFYGYKERVNRLLELGADINGCGKEYGGALYVASSGGHTWIVRRLLDLGAKVNEPCGKYCNALEAALYGREKDTIELLLENGADLNLPGGQEGHALQMASRIRLNPATRRLLETWAERQGKCDLIGKSTSA
ncbi:MAG: hypothetical protein M1837_002392 [Sclerophora amabilis]|nr:MAG: hypothetical protein M1837_002392 [Sclerophora amabilis]